MTWLRHDLLNTNSRTRALRWIAILSAIGALLNGLVFWSRRVGLLQREHYFYGYAEHVQEVVQNPGDFPAYMDTLAFGASLHETQGWMWLASKGLKELVWIAILFLIASQLRSIRLPRSLQVPYAGVIVLGMLSAAAAALSGQWMALVAGIRANMAWLFAIAGAELASESVCRWFARAFVAVVIVQALLIPYEMNMGLTIYWTHLFDTTFARPVGTFNVPASLGAFAVVTWTMAVCWGGFSRRTMVLISLMVAGIVLANSSATAWFAWALAVVGTLYLRMANPLRRIILLLALAPAALMGWIALPQMTGRSDIHDSLWGRIHPIETYARENLSAAEMMIGYRFAAGSNAYAALSGAQTFGTVPGDHPMGDSTPAAIFWQFGVFGVLLGYSAMLIALMRSPASQLVGIAIIGSSLTLNITEHFPLNIAFGLWLANAARIRDPSA